MEGGPNLLDDADFSQVLATDDKVQVCDWSATDLLPENIGLHLLRADNGNSDIIFLPQTSGGVELSQLPSATLITDTSLLPEDWTVASSSVETWQHCESAASLYTDNSVATSSDSNLNFEDYNIKDDESMGLNIVYCNNSTTSIDTASVNDVQTLQFMDNNFQYHIPIDSLKRKVSDSSETETDSSNCKLIKNENNLQHQCEMSTSSDNLLCTNETMETTLIVDEQTQLINDIKSLSKEKYDTLLDHEKKYIVHCISCKEDFTYLDYFASHIEICVLTKATDCCLCKSKCKKSSSNSNDHIIKYLSHLKTHIKNLYTYWWGVGVECVTCHCICPNYYNYFRHLGHAHALVNNTPQLQNVAYKIPEIPIKTTLTNILMIPNTSTNYTCPSSNNIITIPNHNHPPVNMVERSITLILPDPLIKLNINFEQPEPLPSTTTNTHTKLSTEHLQIFCTQCSKHIQINTYLSNHVTKCVIKGDSSYSCPLCIDTNAPPLPKHIYKRHIKTHLNRLVKVDEFQRTCEECSLVFLAECNKNAHFEHQHFPVIFQCNLCENSTTVKGDILAHIFEHHVEHRKQVESFQCKVCDVVCMTSEDYKNHKETHFTTGVDEKKLIGLKRPYYICYVCRRVYHTNLELRNHVESHYPSDREHTIKSIANKLTCELCDYVCKDKVEFIKHMNSHLTSMDENERETYFLNNSCKVFECNFCCDLFATSTGLVNHVNDKHLQNLDGLLQPFYTKSPKCDIKLSQFKETFVGLYMQHQGNLL